MIVLVLVMVNIYLGNNNKKNMRENYQVVQIVKDWRVVKNINTEDGENIDHV